MPTAVTLRVERSLLRTGATAIACLDEVGRGALSGPVAVGVVVVTAETKPAPTGVRDSKVLSAAKRAELAPLIRQWAPHAVGMATPREIDDLGVMAALGLAARRGIDSVGVRVDHVLLDGNVDYVTPPEQGDLFSAQWEVADVPTVTTRIKADMQCAGVAAASIIAKTTRDDLMTQLAREYPEYDWASNKGYASQVHSEALGRLGPTPHHRVSWHLPTA